MLFNEYQSFYRELSPNFKIQGDPTLFACIGMAEEAGECLGKIKRVLRGEEFDRETYILELGDVLGYLTMATNYQDISLEDLINANERLTQRTGFDTQAATLQLFKKVAQVLQVAESNRSDIYHLFANYLAGMLFWIYQCAYSVDSSIEFLMVVNEAKLRDRLQKGTLLGTGDNR